MFISAVSLIKDLRNIEFFRKDFRIQRQIEADINYEYIYLVFFVIFLNLTTKKRAEKSVSFYVNVTVSQTYLKVSLQ